MNSTVIDERQRHAIAELLLAAMAACDHLALGKLSPDMKTCWDDEPSFSAYLNLAVAIDATERLGLGRSPLKLKNCQSCRHFLCLKSARADFPPEEIEGDDDLGHCGRSPPMRAWIPGRPVEEAAPSFFPSVRSQHRCGEWQGFANYTSRL